jgi:hypothetical protein
VTSGWCLRQGGGRDDGGWVSGVGGDRAAHSPLPTS